MNKKTALATADAAIKALAKKPGKEASAERKRLRAMIVLKVNAAKAKVTRSKNPRAASDATPAK